MKLQDIHIRDPFVLLHDDTYYMYGSRGNNHCDPSPGFDVYESRDLVDWHGPTEVFRRPENFWGDRDFWAPEVHIYKDKFYMFASFKSEGACRGTQILTADTPRGPFEPLTSRPVTPATWECLDGTLYVSPKGQPYIVFCHEWVQIGDGEICAMPLTDDLTASAGEPVTLFSASQAKSWVRPIRGQNAYVTDGPFIHRTADGTLLLIWSSFGAQGYTEAIARSASGDITGPWIQEPELLMANDGGHGMLFTTKEGQLKLVLHSPNKSPLERPVFFDIEEHGNILVRLK